MKAQVTRVPRFERMHAWTNRILRVDLTEMRVWAHESAPYVPQFLGARGIAARIAWDEYPEPVDPFDPRNPLMVFPGALTGARSPYSGRTNVCAFSPQGYPYPWFTRSNVGGHFGGELKRAGYDGIVVTGASEEPVRIRIRDDEVSILPAGELWGMDALDTLERLEALDGAGTRSLAIGPAGERLSRIATIQTASSSACGQGGFGAVMGSKQLKAISVRGSGQVSLMDPERVTEIARAVGVEARSVRGLGREAIERRNERLAAEGAGRVRRYACTENCVSPCGLYYEDVPGCAYPRTWSGHWMCVGSLLAGMPEGGPVSYGGVYDWRLGTRGGLEANVLFNRYGINQWDVIIGMVPWLEACQAAGLIGEMNGQAMDWRSPAFWASFLHAMAYGEGMGDALAQGGWRAAKELHLGEDLVRRYYTGWGYAGHWDGHGSWANHLVFPYWLVSALQWATDTRDPIPSGHGYTWYVMYFGPLGGSFSITWEQMRGVSERVYGDPDAVDPYSGYAAKAYPGFYHTRRSVMKDCLPADDFRFPMIYSPNTPDGLARVAGIEGPSLEYHLFKAGTGVDWSEDEFGQAAERVYTLERALQVRHWGRDRTMDESVLPSFEYPENWVNPLLGERYALDRAQFKPVMDDYYRYQGWDVETGWPAPERLSGLDLGDVYEPMVEGAQRAKAVLPEPPPAEPVPVVDLLAG
jgi:aldehyde:ferredoxin oxidoreductase